MALTTEEVPDPGRREQAGPWQGGASVGAQREGVQGRGPCPGQAGWRERERIKRGLDRELEPTPAQKLPEVRGQAGLDWRGSWARGVQGGAGPRAATF